MDISIHTVSFHLKNICENLLVRPGTEAVARVLREESV